MEYYTAPTYENYERLSEPFQKGNKWYITVRLKNGNAKDVRAYTEPQGKTASAATDIFANWNYRKGLGFGEKGYIYIFGNASCQDEFFDRVSEARFHKLWGWYIPSGESIPVYLPKKVYAVMLPWEYVGEGTSLKSDKEVFAGVQRAIKDPSLTINRV